MTHLAQAAMGKPGTIVGVLCKELCVARRTLYLHMGPDGPFERTGWSFFNNIEPP